MPLPLPSPQAEQRELAETIRVSGSILLSTVSNFLDFFKMEAGKQLDIVRTQVDLAGLVSDVHCIIEAMIGRSDEVRLREPDLEGVAATVMCDPDRLRGVLLNLYTNAAKFTKQVGGVVPGKGAWLCAGGWAAVLTVRVLVCVCVGGGGCGCVRLCALRTRTPRWCCVSCFRLIQRPGQALLLAACMLVFCPHHAASLPPPCRATSPCA